MRFTIPRNTNLSGITVEGFIIRNFANGGGGNGVGVGVISWENTVVGIYGVLRAGAAYVPLDPRAPVPRLAFIARDCGIRVLLSGSEKAERWPELLQHGAPVESIVVLNADEVEPGSVTGPQVLTARDVEAQEVGAPPVELIDQDLAYILYTSGSTGNPKGSCSLT